MARVLIIAALIGLVAWWAMSRLRARDARDDAEHTRRERGAGRRNGRRGPQAMVACAHCGVHLPRAEAVADGAGRLYCGDEHRLQGPQ